MDPLDRGALLAGYPLGGTTAALGAGDIGFG